MKEKPLVSVIMNCYNGEKYLNEAIDSVLAQTCQNWEIIFWDNQSTDGSAEIFKTYKDERLKYFYAPKHTLLYEARNHAIERARGDLIAFLDVDDWWLPHKLEKQIPLFSNSEVGIVCSNYWIVSERKKKRWKAYRGAVPTGWVLNDLLKSYFVGLLTLVVRRSALAALSYPCDPRYHVIGDLDLVVRLSSRWKLDCVQEPIATYRVHGDNESLKHSIRHLDELECWLREMKEIDVVRSCPNFHFAEGRIAYLKAIHRILQADRKGAYRLFRDIPWGQLKLRLTAAILLPTPVARRLKN